MEITILQELLTYYFDNFQTNVIVFRKSIGLNQFIP